MIVMAYPYAAPLYTITVRNPNFSDLLKKEMHANFKMSMDGTLYGKRKTIQPDGFSWTFSSLPRAKAEELRTFVVGSAGLEVRVKDHLEHTWRGKMSISQFQITTTERGLGAGVPEFATIGIEFEGVKL